jgi:hypothetical protein
MNSANPPVKHHYIPQFLLAQWAMNDGKRGSSSRQSKNRNF